MTRRDFVCAPAIAVAASSRLRTPVLVPIQRLFDIRSRSSEAQRRRFADSIWPEAVRDFKRCGVQLESRDAPGEIRRSPSDWPILKGLEHGALNIVVTDRIPIAWDSGRGMAGVATLYGAHHVCVIALHYAHEHQVPFFAVNTCVHEILHALMHDIFQVRPKGIGAKQREFRIDALATRLWLFHDGAGIRESAESYVPRLRRPESHSAPRAASA